MLPGNVLTEGLVDLGEDYINEMTASVPQLSRLGTVDEIGYAALFLASDEAAYITGQDDRAGRRRADPAPNPCRRPWMASAARARMASLRGDGGADDRRPQQAAGTGTCGAARRGRAHLRGRRAGAVLQRNGSRPVTSAPASGSAPSGPSRPSSG